MIALELSQSQRMKLNWLLLLLTFFSFFLNPYLLHHHKKKIIKKKIKEYISHVNGLGIFETWKKKKSTSFIIIPKSQLFIRLVCLLRKWEKIKKLTREERETKLSSELKSVRVRKRPKQRRLKWITDNVMSYIYALLSILPSLIWTFYFNFILFSFLYFKSLISLIFVF